MPVFPINTVENKRLALRAVYAIEGADGKEVVIRDLVTEGTKAQQAWFNILCKMIAEDTGNSPEAIKNHVKTEVFGLQDGILNGIKFQYVPRSDFHGMKGYSELIEGVYRIGAEMGIVLPEPRK